MRAAFAAMLAAAMMTMAATGIAHAKSETNVKVDVKRHVGSGKVIKITGKVRPADRRRVTIKAAGRVVKSVKTNSDGTFRALWSTPGAGVYKVKAVAQATYSASRAGSAEKQVNVYRAAQASYYGPGLYGNGTACGTMVTFRYRGRSVRVPVIDRGPFSGNREWDLTAATKAKLGFGTTGVVLATK